MNLRVFFGLKLLVFYAAAVMGFFAILWFVDTSNLDQNSSRSMERKVNYRRKMAKNKKKTSPDIVFIRTSEENLEWFELCAFYTAAQQNPSSRVTLLTPRSFILPQFFSSLDNFGVEDLDYSKIFSQTPLMHWFKTGSWKVDNFVKRVRFLSDAVRLAYLYKHGGLYMDTDFITLRNLSHLKNGLGLKPNVEMRLLSALTLHLWRNQVRKELKNPHLSPPRNSLLYSIAMKECPAALEVLPESIVS